MGSIHGSEDMAKGSERFLDTLVGRGSVQSIQSRVYLTAYRYYHAGHESALALFVFARLRDGFVGLDEHGFIVCFCPHEK